MVHQGILPFILLIISSVSSLSLKFVCPSGMFMCDNSRCIVESMVCDAEDDCGDNSDETSCKPTCTSSQFQCKDGRCIPLNWKCDGDEDCHGGDDEHSPACQESECSEREFRCKSRCIPKAWVCDGERDCLDGKDEANCSSCNMAEFTCHNGRCIDIRLFCNREDDCGDGSDEKCSPQKCTPHQFECADKTCILITWKCDGDSDCPDGSDERDCHNTGHTTQRPDCKENEFACSDGLTCIPSSWVCNGKSECLDGGDEELEKCKNMTCTMVEFQCNDRKCIPGYMQCNGLQDCSDNSDEENCGTPQPRCSENEFSCGGGMCIPIEKACDKKADCPDGEDEPPGICNVNECEHHNGHCSQICVDTPTSFHCDCHNGFELTDNFTCDDVNECYEPGSCSQLCINEKGTFKCECTKGYTKDTLDHRRCKADEGKASLIFTRRHDIRMVNLSNNETKLLVPDTKSAIALDFVYKSKLIFWSDGAVKKIFKKNMFDGTGPITVIERDETNCDGLAVDWIYNHIYWSDTIQDAIKVANFDGSMIKTIIESGLDKPRAIVISPGDGWMFWSDWGITPRIERGGLDGSHRSTIVSHDIIWPNGLALDFEKRRLFWIDAKLDTIFSANYNGGSRRVILKRSETLLHPFSIAVFEYSIYWTDWTNKAIYKADKFDGGNVTAIVEDGSQIPVVVHVFHPYKQPEGVNYCLRARCSHLCLPAPQINISSPKISCVCPDFSECKEDKMQKEQYTKVKPSKQGSRETISEEPVTSGYTVEHHSETVTDRPGSGSIKWKDNQTRNPDLNNGGSSVVIVASSICILLLITLSAIIIFLAHRYYYRRPAIPATFENPMFRRNSDQVILHTSEHSEPSPPPRLYVTK